MSALAEADPEALWDDIRMVAVVLVELEPIDVEASVLNTKDCSDDCRR